MEHFDDGRVIVVIPQDAPAHLNKVSFYRTFCKKISHLNFQVVLRSPVFELL